jgi:hypothetical protein
MRLWNVSTFEEGAFREITAYFADDNVKSEIKRILNLLASQLDPRKPSKSSGLIVDRRFVR